MDGLRAIDEIFARDHTTFRAPLRVTSRRGDARGADDHGSR